MKPSLLPLLAVTALVAAPFASAAPKFNPLKPATLAFDVSTTISEDAFVATLTEAILERGWAIDKTKRLEPLKEAKPDSKAKKEGAFELSYKGNFVTVTYDDTRHVTLLQTGGKVDVTRWLQGLQAEVIKTSMRHVK